MYRASVANNSDPLNEARVTLLIPQILGTAESAWAAPASPTNTVPPVGETLWVQFSGGDITKPIYSPLGLKQVQDQVVDIDGTLDFLPPKQPTSLTLNSAPYVTGEGNTLADLTAGWTAPTENQDGTHLTDLSHYLLQTSYDGVTWSSATVTEDTLAHLDGLHTGVDITVRVQAVDDSNNASLWTTGSLGTASSTTPPPVTSNPVVVGVLGGLRVTWDGLTVTGAAMPTFFDRVQVQRDTSASFSSPVTVATLRGADFVYDSVQNYANAYYYRFVAYSKTGYASAPSAVVYGTAVQAVNTDIIDHAINEVKIKTGGLDASQVLKTGTITAASGIIGNIDAATITVGKLQGSQVATGTLTANNMAVGTLTAESGIIASLDASKITVGKLAASQIDATSLVISGGNVSGPVASATTAGSATTAATATSAGSATTVTGSIGAGVSVPAGQLSNGTIPTTTTINGGSIKTGIIDASLASITNLDASSIKAGTLTVDRLSAGLQGTVGQKFYDFGNSASKWVNGSTGTMTTVAVSDAASGGFVMRCVGYLSGGYRPDVLIPFDPTVTYRITCRIRQTVANSTPGTNQAFYAGVTGIAADGVTLVNVNGANSTSSQAYAIARAVPLTVGGGWVTYTGYVKGTAATGDTGPNNSPTSPMKLHQNVKYISPCLYLNYTGGTGTAEVDVFTIEVVETGVVGTPNILLGSVKADSLDVDALNGKTINGVTITGSSTVTGAVLRTAASGNRVVMQSTTRSGQSVGEIDLYTEVATDTPGTVTAFGPIDGGKRSLQLKAPAISGATDIPTINLTYEPETPASRIEVNAETTYTQDLVVIGTLKMAAGTVYADPSWNTLSYATGWSGFGSSFGTGRYRLMPDGSVILRDLVKRTATTTVTNGEVVATLPAGYLPLTTAQQNFYVGTSTTGGTLSLNVQSNGQITVNNISAGASTYLSAGTGYISLNGIQFFLD
jgi:hypothetical protein